MRTLNMPSQCVGGWMRHSRWSSRLPERGVSSPVLLRQRPPSSGRAGRDERPQVSQVRYRASPRSTVLAVRVYASSSSSPVPSSGSSSISVDVLISTESLNPSHADLESRLRQDAFRITQEAAWYIVKDREDPLSPPLELSVVLCDDGHMRELNRAWRGVDKATDVLSFEMEDENLGGEAAVGFEDQGTARPPVLLGDVVISMDTAQRQADERGHSVLEECRILLAHGVLHLLGFDHEEDEDEAREMEAAERWVLGALGWGGARGDGLIGLVESSVSSGGPSHSKPPPPGRRKPSSGDIRLICLDMDGTLLDPSSSVLESSIEALKLAMERDVRVMLATGKARPAAMAAMEKAGLLGDELVVGLNTPGIFLQGLQVYGRGGVALESGALDMNVARRVLEFAMTRGIAVTCFLGDDCVTPRVTKELEELHYRYYEPYPKELQVEDILKGPPIRKMLMMNDDVGLMRSVRPAMDEQLRQTAAGTMVAVDTMLEVVPRGFNKGTALRILLRDLETDGVRLENVMAIGDGANDLEMVVEAGIGVAMGNAVDIVKASADDVVAANDADGVYQAIMKHVLLR